MTPGAAESIKKGDESAFVALLTPKIVPLKSRSDARDDLLLLFRFDKKFL